MGALSRAARAIGVEWAERTFASLGRRGESIPHEWPGTPEEAAYLVDADEADPFDIDQVAIAVNRAARETWRELVW